MNNLDNLLFEATEVKAHNTDSFLHCTEIAVAGADRRSANRNTAGSTHNLIASRLVRMTRPRACAHCVTPRLTAAFARNQCLRRSRNHVLSPLPPHPLILPRIKID